MHKFFNVGDILYGFCNGYFGSSNYDDKRCVSVTVKYAVFEYINGELEGHAIVLNDFNNFDIDMVNDWKVNKFDT